MAELKTFYEMDQNPSERYARIEDDLIDENGEALDILEGDTELRRAKAKLSSSRKPVSDLPFMVCVNGPLMSDAAYAIVQRYRCCPSIRWIPTDLCRPDGSIAGAYWLAYGSVEHDVWDYAKSDCSWLSGMPRGTREAVGYLKSGVARQRLLPKLDLFQMRFGIWAASYGLAKAVTESGLKGFCFSPLRVDVDTGNSNSGDNSVGS